MTGVVDAEDTVGDTGAVVDGEDTVGDTGGVIPGTTCKICKELTVYGPMFPLSTALLSSEIPSSKVTRILKCSAKKTITLPFL